MDTGLSTATRRGVRRPAHGASAPRTIVHPIWRDDGNPDATDDEDEPDIDGSGFVDMTAGHGTFIAGIIRRLCPDAEVHVEGVLCSFGDGDDLTIGFGLERAANRVAPDHFDVIVMSLGTYTDDDAPPPLASFIDKYVAPTTVLVAAAGNDGSCRPYYPAALPEVVRSAPSTARAGRGSPTSVRGSTRARRASMSSAPTSTSPSRRAWAYVRRMGGVERHQLLGTEGRGSHRAGHVHPRRPRCRRVAPTVVVAEVPLRRFGNRLQRALR